jgi:glycosyltransferase involved in cell wall biosynthesis
LGYPADRFVVIHNGINTEIFQPNTATRHAVRAELGIGPSARVVAHVARVDPMKDHASLTEALRRLPAVKALLIGQGTEKLPPQSGVYRLGRREDIPRLLCAADAIVSSSAFGEGFSNAIAEGMASGLPAVVTDTGDARHMVGESGIVVPPRNVGALAEGLARVLSETQQQHAMRSAAARDRIEASFSLARAVDAFRNLYRSQ